MQNATKKATLSNETQFSLPPIPSTREQDISSILTSLNLDRTILASNNEISTAWSNLNTHLTKVPSNYRNEHLARMCIAIQTGLFDAAINYIWNLSILNLRDKVNQFGFSAIKQIIGKHLDGSQLDEMRDSELIELCLKLNLINEEAFYFIDQCRDIRNKFSAAHPPIGKVDDSELVTFISRCCKHIFSSQPRIGIDIKSFIQTIKASGFNHSQTTEWARRINETYSAQRDFIIATMNGIYCDPDIGEESRRNTIEVCKNIEEISPNAIKELNDRHSEYVASGDEKRAQMSRAFFDELGILSMLADSEKFRTLSIAITNLKNAHLGFGNFYSEPAFAEHLKNISSQIQIQDVLKLDFVETVVSARIGNGYGISNKSVPAYDAMIRNFSPKEIAILLELIYKKESRISQRLGHHAECKRHLKYILKKLIASESIPTSHKHFYDRFMEGK